MSSTFINYWPSKVRRVGGQKCFWPTWQQMASRPLHHSPGSRGSVSENLGYAGPSPFIRKYRQDITYPPALIDAEDQDQPHHLWGLVHSFSTLLQSVTAGRNSNTTRGGRRPVGKTEGLFCLSSRIYALAGMCFCVANWNLLLLKKSVTVLFSKARA